MKGSKKQVALAKDIRAKFVSNAKPLLGKNPNADRAIKSILSINKANFWISYEYSNWRILLKSLYSVGLHNKGDGWSNVIQADRDTHTITETWTEIVPNGKRGQKIKKNRIWDA
ncbi:MAG: hypothetical protein HQQ73_02105 [Desulfobulbaceae bacterium]|nr:hypothetical protein [Desulfobulbaceae bacterium]